MKKLFNRLSAVILAAACMMLGISTANAANYLIVSNGKASINLAKQVADAGGTITASYPFGVTVASSDNPAFADSISGVQFVVEDPGFEVERAVMEVEFQELVGDPPTSGDDDFFFDLQWGHNFVGAQNAWNAGVTGAGVRVAVLDGGFDLTHPDLAPNINFGLSMDFTGEGLQYGLPDPFSHGSHTAGTIAAADNSFGTIGVAPDAELVLVKVLGDSGSGSFANIIAGIYYAANTDADVISMSLGLLIPRQVAGVTQVAVAVQQAMTYARQQGSLVISSAGNDAHDLDGDGSMVRFNNGLTGTLGISAATTQNWAGGNNTLYPASYTNYGTSQVDFSAPGGGADYPGNEGCIVAGLARPCWVFDLVFSTGNRGWYWSAGTSMAAPHAAGVAALIISENGGDMTPAMVISEMRNRGIDLGTPGADDFFGRHGLTTSGY